MSQVTIIMYHYVRELPLSRYPKIKGLKVSDFKKQLNYLKKTYNFVTVDHCRAAIYGNSADFPENAALLTFDDGYKEHYTEVFPILHQMGIQGAFFPPAQAITEHKVMDVNKIHFILASVTHPEQLVKKVNAGLVKLSDSFSLKKPDYYMNKLGNAEHRYDPPKIVYIKRLLQHELPERPRRIILNELFDEFIGVDEKIFAKELYMNTDQIKCMLRNGMFVGGHGYSHKWLNTMKPEEQYEEIQKTRDFLDFLGISTNNWVMCYPYGAYDKSLINILKAENCSLGIGTKVGVAVLNKENAFSLKRMDTNDFPPVKAQKDYELAILTKKFGCAQGEEKSKK